MSQPVIPSDSYTETDYYNLPENVHAELIEGQFYNMSAPSLIHQSILGGLYLIIGNYLKSKGSICRVFPAPFAVKLFDDDKTIVEPDISVICDRTKLTEKGCCGAPDWIIEIASPGNPGHDFIYKLNLYANARVREYWIVNPLNQSVYVYYLEKNYFDTAAYSFQDRVKARIYDDLWINFKELDVSF